MDKGKLTVSRQRCMANERKLQLLSLRFSNDCEGTRFLYMRSRACSSRTTKSLIETCLVNECLSIVNDVCFSYGNHSRHSDHYSPVNGFVSAPKRTEHPKFIENARTQFDSCIINVHLEQSNRCLRVIVLSAINYSMTYLTQDSYFSLLLSRPHYESIRCNYKSLSLSFLV